MQQLNMANNKNIKKEKKKRKTKKDRKPIYEIRAFSLAIPEESLDNILKDMSNHSLNKQ